MRETLKGVQDIFDQAGPTDATATFDRLWSITGEIMAKLQSRFETGPRSQHRRPGVVPG